MGLGFVLLLTLTLKKLDVSFALETLRAIIAHCEPPYLHSRKSNDVLGVQNIERV